jgi:hypothetical protein
MLGWKWALPSSEALGWKALVCFRMIRGKGVSLLHGCMRHWQELVKYYLM